MASAAAVAAGIDRRDVSKGQGHLCGGPGTGGGGPPASRSARAPKIRFWTYLGSHFTVRLVYAFFMYRAMKSSAHTQNRAKNHCFEAVTNVIDRHDVSIGQEYPCRRPGAGGGGLAAARADAASKIRFQPK